MNQPLLGLLGFAIGLVVLYGVVRWAFRPQARSWMAPPSGGPIDSSSGWIGPDDGAAGHHHGP